MEMCEATHDPHRLLDLHRRAATACPALFMQASQADIPAEFPPEADSGQVSVGEAADHPMSDLFLLPEELVELTGYKRQSDQVRWLIDRAYAFELNKDGYPRVLREALIAKLGGRIEPGGFSRKPKLRFDHETA